MDSRANENDKDVHSGVGGNALCISSLARQGLSLLWSVHRCICQRAALFLSP